MSNEIPRRLVKVVDNTAEPIGTEELSRTEVETGQIWIAAPDEGPGVLVLITDVSQDHVLVLLCSNEGDRATETDAELAPRLTGCPYHLLVHGDLAGSIMRTRLVGSPGRIDPALVPRIVVRGLGMDFNSRDLGRGTPIVTESDPRWETKAKRLKQLRTVKARASELGLKISTLSNSRDPDSGSPTPHPSVNR
jgi:hypothetical protein